MIAFALLSYLGMALYAIGALKNFVKAHWKP